MSLKVAIIIISYHLVQVPEVFGMGGGCGPVPGAGLLHTSSCAGGAGGAAGPADQHLLAAQPGPDRPRHQGQSAGRLLHAACHRPGLCVPLQRAPAGAAESHQTVKLPNAPAHALTLLANGLERCSAWVLDSVQISSSIICVCADA